MSEKRDIKDGPFCWQNKATLKLITESFAESNQAVSARSLYVALTEIASDEQSETFTATKALIAHKAGLSIKTIERLLAAFEQGGLLKIDRGLAKAHSGAIKSPNTYTLLSMRHGDVTSMRHEGKHAPESDKVEESGRISEEKKKNVVRAHGRDKAAAAVTRDFSELEKIARQAGNDPKKLIAVLQPDFPKIDLSREFAAYHGFMGRHGKQPTSSGFVRSWLARIEPTLPPLICKTGSNGASKPQPDGWREWRVKNYPDARVHDFWLVTPDV